MSGAFRQEWQGVSDIGTVRAVNEDSFTALPERGVWIVADGMGGHAGGDWASSRIVAAVAAGRAAPILDEAVVAVAEAIHAANAAIWAEAATRGASMGSTVVALVVRERRFAALWAGDSRAWLLREGELHQLTIDHSQVQAMVERGLLTAEEAASHPMSHVLARAVGVEAELELDVIVDEAAAGDLFLLTSDGVHGVVPPSEMAEVARTTDLPRLPAALIARATERGSSDNMSAVAVQLHEPTLVRLAPSAQVTS